MNKLKKRQEQLMNNSQTKCDQVVHEQGNEQNTKSHEQLMNKSQTKCEQVVHEQGMSYA